MWHIFICVIKMLYLSELNFVKAESAGILDKMHFGYLVDTSSPYGPDYEQNLCEIEFTDDDIIDEYQLKEMMLPYMDFSFKG